MSASQQHGFEIEGMIKADIARRSRITKSVALSSSHVSRFDAPGYSDPYARGIPTSIKTAKQSPTGRTLVCMADATRIAELADVSQMRLLVAVYDQVGDRKVFSQIREYIITSEEWLSALGGAPSEVLGMFNSAIKLKDPAKARAAAREWKKRMADDYPSVMRWNPKIDSKGQRRLQCSIRMEDLDALVKDPKRIRVFGDVPGATAKRLWGDGPQLPITLESKPRIRHKRESKTATAPAATSIEPKAMRA